MRSTLDAHDNELTFHAMQLIQRPDWIANSVRDIKRAQTIICYLYRRCNNHVQCFMWTEVYDLEATSRRVAEYAITGALLTVVKVSACAAAKKCSKLIAAANSKKWFPVATSVCHICYKDPDYFTDFVDCAGCLSKVCRACSRYHDIFEVDEQARKPLRDRLCKLCLSKVIAPGPLATQRRTQDSGASANDSKTGYSDAEILRFIDLADMQCYTTSSSDESESDEDQISMFLLELSKDFNI
jgi:hypothetical protein